MIGTIGPPRAQHTERRRTCPKQKKKLQHPIGGVIRELLVHDGDVVKSGQVIVRLDDTQARSILAIQTKRLDELMARQAREEAERDGVERIVFPEELMKRADDPDVARLMAGQERLFNIRRKAREGQKAQLELNSGKAWSGWKRSKPPKPMR